MSYGEAIALVGELSRDPSSRFGAALQGWSYPASFEYLAIRSLAENYFLAHTKRSAEFSAPPVHPAHKVKRLGGTSAVTVAEFEARMAAHRNEPGG